MGNEILFFYSSRHCKGCELVKPIVESLSSELGGVVLKKIDVDISPKLVNSYTIRSVPTIVVLKDGKPYRSLVGFSPSLKETLRSILNG